MAWENVRQLFLRGQLRAGQGVAAGSNGEIREGQASAANVPPPRTSGGSAKATWNWVVNCILFIIRISKRKKKSEDSEPDSEKKSRRGAAERDAIEKHKTIYELLTSEELGWKALEASMEEILREEGVKQKRSDFDDLPELLRPCLLCCTAFPDAWAIRKNAHLAEWMRRKIEETNTKEMKGESQDKSGKQGETGENKMSKKKGESQDKMRKEGETEDSNTSAKGSQDKGGKEEKTEETNTGETKGGSLDKGGKEGETGETNTSEKGSQEDWAIKKRTLIYWWIGEGFFVGTPPPNDWERRTAEEVGEAAFDDLVRYGLVEPTYAKRIGRVKEFKLHPLVRWMLIEKAEEENFFEFDQYGTPSGDPKSSDNPKPSDHPEPSDDPKPSYHPKPSDDPKPSYHPNKSLCPRAFLTKSKISPYLKGQKEDNQKSSDCPKSSDNPKPSDQSNKSLCPRACLTKGKISPYLKGQKEDNKNSDSGASPDLGLHQKPKLMTLVNSDSQYLNFDEGPITTLGALKVLQIGRWHGSAEYHVEMVESGFLNNIGFLKNLRYLGLQGISGLVGLPDSIQNLVNLEILDLRGCQNLERVSAKVEKLKKLLRLDLTECFMLQEVPKGVASLDKLEVLKGFVIGTTVNKRACGIKDLVKLKKLRKLSINVTRQSKVGEDDFQELDKMTTLVSLTLTWGALPAIFDEKVKGKKELGNKYEKEEKKESGNEKEEKKESGNEEEKKESGNEEEKKESGNEKEEKKETEQKKKELTRKEKDLVDKWTKLKLPANLKKLDLRCFPKEKLGLWLGDAEQLEKLYIRGSERLKMVTAFEGGDDHGHQNGVKKEIPGIKTLRLKYVEEFSDGVEDIMKAFTKLEYLEIVKRDSTNTDAKKDGTKFDLDKDGVWVKRDHEVPDEQTSTSKEAAAATTTTT